MAAPGSRAVIDADHGQFVLLDPSGAELGGTSDVDLPLVSFTSDDPLFVVVCTGAQVGPVEVTAVPRNEAPTLDDEWDEAAELSMHCLSGLVVSALMSEPALTLCAAGGLYRLRISAAGRRDAAELEYDELVAIDRQQPVERYLIEAWPGPVAPPAVLRGSVEQARPSIVGLDADDDAAVETRARACTDAGARIGVDLNGAPTARVMSGRRGAARIKAELPRSIDRIWQLIAYLDITNVSSRNEASVGNEFGMSTYGSDQDGFVGRGQILCRWTELDPPTRVAMTWQWTATARQPATTTLSVTLIDRSAGRDEPTVELELVHADLPVEWVHDMTAIWHSKLDMWMYQSRPRKRRR